MSDPRLPAIQEALEAGSYERALQLTEGDAPPSPELLDLRARAAYGAGNLEETLTAYERLHRLHLDADRPHDAAMAAGMVAMYLMMDTGLMAPVRAWLKRAEHLLDDAPDSAVWGMLSVVHAYERFMCGDMPGAGAWAARAVDAGRRHDLAGPTLLGRLAGARVRMHDGDLEGGLATLDDIAVEISAGTLDPLTSGQIWCELICAMQWVGQHDRAEQWTEAMEHWRKGAAFGGLSGRCRVHRAEILRLRGPCDSAEQEALLACEELRPWMRREYGWPLTELGNVRFQKGDFAGAEEAFLAAHQNAWSPEPGLALLRLAQGRGAEALSLIVNALDHPPNVPSKEMPPSGDLRRAPLLAAEVPIAIAAGKGDLARSASAELARIADRYRSRTLRNAALVARGRVALAEGRSAEAIADLSGAVMEWMSLRMPFDAAMARVSLADAHRSAKDIEAAEHELDAACRSLDELGAAPWIELVRRGVPPSERRPVASPETCVFRCEGDTRTITFAGLTVLLKDLKGMRYLERLLAEPHREFHALDLVSVERGALPTGRYSEHPESARDAPDAGLEVFDDRARDAYRRRLVEVEADIEEAEANNDLGRASLARADRQFLIDELTRGVGLGGRARTVGGGVERARTSATRSLRYAIDRIAEHHEPLGAHLDRAIRSGTYFSYAPDLGAVPAWEI